MSSCDSESDVHVVCGATAHMYIVCAKKAHRARHGMKLDVNELNFKALGFMFREMLRVFQRPIISDIAIGILSSAMDTVNRNDFKSNAKYSYRCTRHMMSYVHTAHDFHMISLIPWTEMDTVYDYMPLWSEG